MKGASPLSSNRVGEMVEDPERIPVCVRVVPADMIVGADLVNVEIRPESPPPPPSGAWGKSNGALVACYTPSRMPKHRRRLGRGCNNVRLPQLGRPASQPPGR